MFSFDVQTVIVPNHFYKSPLFPVKNTPTKSLCDMPNHYSTYMHVSVSCPSIFFLIQLPIEILVSLCLTIFYLHLMRRVWFSGQTLRWRSVCRKFISECSGDQHLWGGDWCRNVLSEKVCLKCHIKQLLTPQGSLKKRQSPRNVWS